MKNEKCYFIGFVKSGSKVIVQLRKSKDYLSCELWQYFGERITTKKRIYEQRKELLSEINTSYKTNFKYIQID